MKRVLVVVCTLLSLSLTSVFAQQAKAVVNVSVADQRADQSLQLVNYSEDKMENTQLLYMESVNILYQEGEWSYTEAIAQKIFANDTWQPYGGWMLTSQLYVVTELPSYSLVVTENWAPIFSRSCNPFGCLPADIFIKVSLGTYLPSPQSSPANGWWPVELHNGQIGWISASFVIPLSQWQKSSTSAQRTQLVTIVQQLLGQIYFWGGRSAFNEDLWNSGSQLTGVDCSGLVSLSYKTIGKLLPRNANEIFLASVNVTSGPTGLKAGDVLFLAYPQTPSHMYHVMMVLDENFLAESNYDSASTPSSLPHQFTPVLNNGTRIVSYVDKFGVPLSALRFGQQVPYQNSYVYWGSYF